MSDLGRRAMSNAFCRRRGGAMSASMQHAGRAFAAAVAASMRIRPVREGMLGGRRFVLPLALAVVVGIVAQETRAQTDQELFIDVKNPYSELENIWCLSDKERQELSKLYGDLEQAMWRRHDAMIEYNSFKGVHEQFKLQVEKSVKGSADHKQAATLEKAYSLKMERAAAAYGDARAAYTAARRAYAAAIDAAKAKAQACPRPVTEAESFYFLIQTLKNSGRLDLAERLAATGQQTFGST